jgi:alkanesulfonate monooxygenase SsuD/methylene tetrahydromethanopterin reductase-like flavin-dependent oxidoreductase (luciferase family)
VITTAIRPGRRIGLGFKTSPQQVDWPTLEATWRLAGELDIFDSAWMNDHLSRPGQPRGGSSYEALTTAAALAHLVPGMWIGHGVLSNTFRHPAVLAKAATVMDNVTDGRFIVGLGAGWHQGEHDAFGITLPPIGERIDRMASAVGVLRALFSSEATREPGVTREDRFYPLHRAVNDPPPVRPGGPPIWLGGQKPRGLRLAATLADGWFLAPDDPGVPNFIERRSNLLRHPEEKGRDPSRFAFVVQVAGGRSEDEDRAALSMAEAYVEAGATHVVIAIPAARGTEALRVAVERVAEPLLATVG